MPKDPKAAKKKKDPNAPKRPLAAYMFFCKEMRESVKEENPEVTFGEIGKILGKKWADAEADEKKRFTELADKDKVRYDKEKKEYDAR
mmetsp:Transcript_23978/g.52365  ORF Transcript_23978/g.52365 Transcript_23978/m.52365 type:complete len:88 (-) Transcript_23978:325-588(-)